ncbi:MAG TPA: MBL fold metallo-hydrolase [Aequorivita sp.]|nr:MBL fold metallo-hydrolase [Aequorivita sp.]
MLSRLLLTSTFLFFTILSSAQTDTGKPFNTKLLKLSNKIYSYEGKGGNVGLSIGDDGIFMVDSQFAESIPEFFEDTKKFNKSVRFLVNTHYHEDHTGGNLDMAKAGAVIVSQENTRKRLQGEIKKETKKMSPQILPTITFSDELTFYFNNEKIQILHLPNAHTDGDAVVYFTESNVLHTGDLFFNGNYPYIDLQSGGGVKGYIGGMSRLMDLIDKNTKIIPGHGPNASYNDLEESMNMLSNTFKQVMQLEALGKTEDEVAKMKNLTEPYDAKGYGKGFVKTEDFLRTLYKDVVSRQTDKLSRIEENEKAQKEYDRIKKEHDAKKAKKKE